MAQDSPIIHLDQSHSKFLFAIFCDSWRFLKRRLHHDFLLEIDGVLHEKLGICLRLLLSSRALNLEMSAVAQQDLLRTHYLDLKLHRYHKRVVSIRNVVPGLLFILLITVLIVFMVLTVLQGRWNMLLNL